MVEIVTYIYIHTCQPVRLEIGGILFFYGLREVIALSPHSPYNYSSMSMSILST